MEALSISIHALLAESDRCERGPGIADFDFYPRSPCGERLGAPVDKMPSSSISIHALLAESDPLTLLPSAKTTISIHALLAESDNVGANSAGFDIISIHALLAESDVKRICFYTKIPKFLSTLSLRRATQYEQKRTHVDRYFYPRSPCGERRHAGGTGNNRGCHFYPRSPCGERRGPKLGQLFRALISIHALLAESDGSPDHRAADPRDFYPRSPCGERQDLIAKELALAKISIHALLAESDKACLMRLQVKGISIHALLAESDNIACMCIHLLIISIHALLAESDCQRSAMQSSVRPFLSTLSLRRATIMGGVGTTTLPNFYPRSPCGERRCRQQGRRGSF